MQRNMRKNVKAAVPRKRTLHNGKNIIVKQPAKVTTTRKIAVFYKQVQGS